MTLYTNEVMTENQAIYAHLGYQETSRAQQDVYRRVFMEKRLTCSARCYRLGVELCAVLLALGDDPPDTASRPGDGKADAPGWSQVDYHA